MAELREAHDGRGAKPLIADERWEPIPGYEGRYEVSSYGRVRSYVPRGTATRPLDVPRILKTPLVKGYPHLTLVVEDGSRRQFYVHTLVLEAFVSPRPDGMECCHNDGNSENNRLDNLRWDSRQSNAQDRVRHGTAGRPNNVSGELHHNARLNADKVRWIRASWPKRSASALARDLGISSVSVDRVVHRKTWKHVSA